MEKVNQLYYTAWLKNPDTAFALIGKKVAVIAHGGSVLPDNPDIVNVYRNLLLKPLHYSLRSFGMDVVGLDGNSDKGVLFGVDGYNNKEEEIFPDMVHNWNAIKETITPLVNQLIQ
jgi:hypothetical protein